MKVDTALMIRKQSLMEIMWRETSSGMLVGLKIKDVDVHLQFVFDEGRKILSAHISDKRPGHNPYPWRYEASIDQMLKSMETQLQNSIRRYKPGSKYRQLHPGLLSAMGYGAGAKKLKEYDIAPMIVALGSGRPFRKCLVRDGLKHRVPRPGIIFKDGECFFIMPLDEQWVWVQNTDIRKTIFWDLPTTRGFFAYFAYLEKHKIIEKSGWLSHDKKRKLKVAILALLAEAEGRSKRIND